MEKRTLRKFKGITKFDIDSFFDLYIDFSDNFAQNVISFFSGETEKKDRQSFQIFDELKRQTRTLLNIIDKNTLYFNSYDFFNLIEQVENIQGYIDTLNNYPKYAKTVKVNDSYVRKLIVQYTKSQNDSLEGIQQKIIGSSDPDSWNQLAIKNKITEEMMRSDLLINVEIGEGEAFIIENVMKGIEKAEDTFGLDIDRNISFLNNDFVSLDEAGTLSQSILVMLLMRKGDNPYSKEYGVDKRLLGSSNAAFAYNTIIRNILETVASDDSLQSIEIQDIFNEGDAVFINTRVKTKTGIFIEQAGVPLG